MAESRTLLVGLGVLAVVVLLCLGAWFCTRTPPSPPVEPEPPPPRPIRFGFEELTVDATGIVVGPALVRGAVQPGFTSWLVIVECMEPEGCAGEARVTIDYEAASGSGSNVITGRFDAAMGSSVRFEGLGKEPVTVSGVRRVSIEATERWPLGAPPADEELF